MTEAIKDLLATQAKELISANASGIAEELKTAEDGKLSVSLSAKLVLVGNKLCLNSGIAYSRKFRDETEGVVELKDPLQPELGDFKAAMAEEKRQRRSVKEAVE